MASFGGPPLCGRRKERDALDRLLDEARIGRSGVLVISGEAGAGKTALVNYAAERASNFRIEKAWGVESEMELPYAGLQQLCARTLDLLPELPEPQRDALCVAFGLSKAAPPDRFLVGLAALSLLSKAAEDTPVLCLIDDAHWLDRASVQLLAFVARRLLAERIAMLFVVRERTDENGLRGLPELHIDGLAEYEARQLLELAVHGGLDTQVRDRIVAETHGNPLALLELPRVMTPLELAGGFGLPNPSSMSRRIEASFVQRIQDVPEATRRFLLVAAAEPVGDPARLWLAARQLGIGAAAVGPAEAAGLVEIGTRVRFRHPLVRSGIYQAASLADRRAAHQALAEVTDAALDPDRRAWHRARAVPGPDETVADELEHSAGRAQARGGMAAAAAFLQRATELTPDPGRRAYRALAAASAMFEAGAPAKADQLLATAAWGPLDELAQARLAQLKARIAFARTRGSEAPPLLLDAAALLGPLDPKLSRETYLEAIAAAMFAGSHGRVAEVAATARAAPPAPRPPRAVDRLLDALTIRYTEGYRAGVAGLQQALAAMARPEHCCRDDNRWLWMGCRVATDVWDDESWHQLAGRQLQLARDNGALKDLPVALTYRAGVHVHAGELAAAAELVAEAEPIAEAAGNAPFSYSALMVAAWTGRRDAAIALIQDGIDDAKRRGEGRAISMAQYSLAVLFNGLGRYEEALGPAVQAYQRDDLALAAWAMIELIEAAVRVGQDTLAADTMRQLRDRTQASGTDWALGVQARSLALCTDGPAAEPLYQEAIERLARSRIVVHLARAHLLYGEWLRREGRRAPARPELRRAHELFARFGAEAFAQRARRELAATGETVGKRNVDRLSALTTQEVQIARLAGAGQTNSEIGSELFLSARTVEWHLSKVFAKLGISSRRELRDALPVPG